MTDEAAGTPGPHEEIVRRKVKELEQIREMLREAHRQKAAGRIEELQAEVARRLRELKELLD